MNGKLLAEWFWTDRWTGSTAFLLPIEPRGLYREMLTAAWRRGAQLPADPETVRRAIACNPEEWERCWPLVAGHWRREGHLLVNDTQLEVYAEAQRRAALEHERAVRGGQARAAQLREQVLKQLPEQSGRRRSG